MKLLGIEMDLETFDSLIVAQNNGKELKVIDGKVVAIDHEFTQEELQEQRIIYIKDRLKQLSEDFIQSLLGAKFNNIDERKEEFISLHNELRQLLGKEPRTYNTIDGEEDV